MASAQAATPTKEYRYRQAFSALVSSNGTISRRPRKRSHVQSIRAKSSALLVSVVSMLMNKLESCTVGLYKIMIISKPELRYSVWFDGNLGAKSDMQHFSSHFAGQQLGFLQFGSGHQKLIFDEHIASMP